MWGFGTCDLHACQRGLKSLAIKLRWMMDATHSAAMAKKGAMQLHMIGSALGTNQTKYVTVIHNMPGASSRVLWGSMTGRGDMCCCSALGDTVIFGGVPNKICRTPSVRSAVPQRHRGCYGAIGILFLWGFLVLPWSNWVYIDPGCRQHFSG